MSQKQINSFHQLIEQILPHLGHWQALVVALYSLVILVARHTAASRVSETLAVMGQPTTVQRRLERYLENKRIEIAVCHEAWTRWVLRHWTGNRDHPAGR